MWRVEWKYGFWELLLDDALVHRSTDIYACFEYLVREVGYSHGNRFYITVHCS